MSFAWIIFILVALLSYAVQYNLRNKFERYSHELLASGLSGAEVAQKKRCCKRMEFMTLLSRRRPVR